ncbi:MAG: hypothetical protein IKT54_06310 [Clostridia bacterium]|nr:hypothetical protein [Clostridia bacterium]
MKRFIVLVFAFVFLLLFVGCENTENKGNDISQTPTNTITPTDTTNPIMEQPIDSNPIDTIKEIKSITDNTNDMDLPDVEEPFFEDERYIYIFGNPISQHVIVEYIDGNTENIKEALENGHIQITDLDKYSINYFAEPKLIEKIVDLTANGEISTADALEGFFSDSRYAYSFPSIKSKYVTVYYKDGTEQTVKDALAEGKIKISDLDWFGIQYYKEPVE